MTQWIDNWPRPKQVKALQTSNSFKQYPSFDVHPNQAEIKAINHLVSEFDLPHTPIFLHQNHGNEVYEYTATPKSQLAIQADACFTRRSGIVCAVMTADCLPVLLTDDAGSFVAAVHCGWRSLYANILERTLNQINSNNTIIAWFGPCIQQQQYEVDESFLNRYLNQHPNSQSAFTAIKGGKSFANLSEMARIQLNTLGVTDIKSNNLCTLLSQQYYSWRQNNTHKRMASMTWITN